MEKAARVSKKDIYSFSETSKRIGKGSQTSPKWTNVLCKVQQPLRDCFPEANLELFLFTVRRETAKKIGPSSSVRSDIGMINDMLNFNITYTRLV